jgi:hypothetical protein
MMSRKVGAMVSCYLIVHRVAPDAAGHPPELPVDGRPRSSDWLLFEALCQVAEPVAMHQHTPASLHVDIAPRMCFMPLLLYIGLTIPSVCRFDRACFGRSAR